jgi:uncharacterized membrane protein YhaH (DUF805 family)
MIDSLLLPLRRTFDYRGRARRSEYWAFVLWQLAIMAVVLNLASFVVSQGTDGMEVVIWTGLVQAGVFALPMLALQVRRLHDQGMSGWWLLVGLVPYIGAGWLFWLMVARGTPGANHYGEDPRRLELDAALFE